jgi:CheY-like chemotaxis protein
VLFRSIRVSAREEGADVLIEVADDGVGLSPEQARQVFELFYQAPQALDRARGGLGLGLPIVRSLVEMHGGTVGVSSDGLGQGSRFSVRLPTVPAPVEPSTVAHPVPPRSEVAAPQRIVVVDDNQDAADSIAALLEMNGHTVEVAYTPQAALDLIAPCGAQLAILDIGLPGMDGYELAAAIRERAGGHPIRLVALTGYGRDGDVRRAIDAGFDAHLTKPVEPDALLAAITPPPAS